jgi:hypothetical protein
MEMVAIHGRIDMAHGVDMLAVLMEAVELKRWRKASMRNWTERGSLWMQELGWNS